MTDEKPKFTKEELEEQQATKRQQKAAALADLMAQHHEQFSNHFPSPNGLNSRRRGAAHSLFDKFPLGLSNYYPAMWRAEFLIMVCLLDPNEKQYISKLSTVVKKMDAANKSVAKEILDQKLNVLSPEQLEKEKLSLFYPQISDIFEDKVELQLLQEKEKVSARDQEKIDGLMQSLRLTIEKSYRSGSKLKNANYRNLLSQSTSEVYPYLNPYQHISIQFTHAFLDPENQTFIERIKENALSFIDQGNPDSVGDFKTFVHGASELVIKKNTPFYEMTSELKKKLENR